MLWVFSFVMSVIIAKDTDNIGSINKICLLKVCSNSVTKGLFSNGFSGFSKFLYCIIFYQEATILYSNETESEVRRWKVNETGDLHLKDL